MPQFLKFLFASCLGTILALGVITLIGTCAIGGLVASAEDKPEIKSNSVLRLSAPTVLPEKTDNVAVDPFSFSTESVTGLQDMRRAIRHAKTDDDIKGIFIDLQGFAAGFASINALRDALVDFKSSGKFIVAYSDYFSQNGYYLASTADVVMVNPVGGMDFGGLAASIPFMKELLDKLGVKMEVFYVGEFKSATEPFRRNDMSKENRYQIRQYLGELYDIYLQNIAESRGKTVAELQNIADNLLIRRGEDAITYGLADQTGYRADIYKVIKDRLGLDDDDDINSIGLATYADAVVKLGKGSDRVAIVYAEGTIGDGSTGLGTIGGDDYAKIFRKIRENDDIGAVVLRVNSGGGSALASENILYEVKRVQEAGKPVIVSMGDFAASGGYYIAASADKIYAEPSTLTGSIGIFGVLPNLSEMTREKVGIHFDSVKTARHALIGDPFYEIDDPQREIIQSQLEEGYRIFIDRVAKGRGMTPEQVDEIARGRVWTGTQALRVGLVDELGGMDEAVAAAAVAAGYEADDYRITEYPRVQDPIQELLKEITGEGKKTDPMASIREELLEGEFGEFYPYIRQARELSEMKGPQARLPFELRFE